MDPLYLKHENQESGSVILTLPFKLSCHPIISKLWTIDQMGPDGWRMPYNLVLLIGFHFQSNMKIIKLTVCDFSAHICIKRVQVQLSNIWVKCLCLFVYCTIEHVQYSLIQLYTHNLIA